MVLCCLFSVCAAGFGGAFDPAAPGTGCTQCAAGQFKAATGNVVCTDCPAGQISAAAGATACSACLADEFAHTAGQSSCDSCDATSETTNSLTGQSACGKSIYLTHLWMFKNKDIPKCMNQTFFISFLFSVCAAGYQGPWFPRAGNCISCVPGQFNPVAGGVCTDCPAGTISIAAGATSCDACQADEYTDTAGQAACYSCGIGATTNGLTGQSGCSKITAIIYLFFAIYVALQEKIYKFLRPVVEKRLFVFSVCCWVWRSMGSRGRRLHILCCWEVQVCCWRCCLC